VEKAARNTGVTKDHVKETRKEPSHHYPETEKERKNLLNVVESAEKK